MTREQFIHQYNELEDSIKALEKQIDQIYKKKGKLISKYVEDNRPYEDGTILKVKCRVGKAIRYKICKVDGCWVGRNDKEVHPELHEGKPYEGKHQPRDGKTYWHFDRRSGINADEILEYTVLNKEDYPTCSCDTCCWLEAYSNTIGDDVPKLHCAVLLDREVYEEGRPACRRYSWWTWSPKVGGVSHREYLLKSKGECSEGEKQANKIFGNILNNM